MLPFAMTIFYLFDASSSTDVKRYECEFFMREIIEVACVAGQTPPCYGTGPPVSASCIVEGSADPTADFCAMTVPPLPGQVVYGHIRAVDFANNASEYVTQEVF